MNAMKQRTHPKLWTSMIKELDKPGRMTTYDMEDVEQAGDRNPKSTSNGDSGSRSKGED